MHVILKVLMADVEKANEAINSGKLPKIVESVSKIMKPEATFFYAEEGCRTGIFIFDLQDVSMIPQIAEPFFVGLNARIQLYPAMNVEELTKGPHGWHKMASEFTSSSASLS